MRSTEVARFAGITYRQLDHWTRGGLLTETAKGTGSTREYTRAEAEKARLIKCLMDVGFTVDQAAKIATATQASGVSVVYLGHGATLHLDKHTH